MRRAVDQLSSLKRAIRARSTTRRVVAALAVSVLLASSYVVITSAAPVSQYAKQAALLSARSIAGAVGMPSGGAMRVLSRLLPRSAQQSAAPTSASSATVATDARGYAPGSTVRVKGGGWAPNLSIDVEITEVSTTEPNGVLDAYAALHVTSDAKGQFETQFTTH